MKNIRLLVVISLFLVGVGCSAKPVARPSPPGPECPPVDCRAMCRGEQMQTMMPAGCPMPLCACDPQPMETK